MPQTTTTTPATSRVVPALTFADIPGTGDIKVLNYALALEALEADLYNQALLRLTTGGTNALGQTIPGLNVASTQSDVIYVREFGTVEAQHRDFLNGALGAQSLINPTNGAFRNARFDFNIQNLSRQQVVELLYTVENLGTQAYLGAIRFFATRNFLLVAGGIQATEARHTAVIASIYNTLFSPRFVTAPLPAQTVTGDPASAGIDNALPPDQVLAAASPFIVL